MKNEVFYLSQDEANQDGSSSNYWNMYRWIYRDIGNFD